MQYFGSYSVDVHINLLPRYWTEKNTKWQLEHSIVLQDLTESKNDRKEQ